MRGRAGSVCAALGDEPDRGSRPQHLCRLTVRPPEFGAQNRACIQDVARTERLRAAARYFPTELLPLVWVRVSVLTAQSPVSGSGVGLGAGVGCAGLCNFARVLVSSTQTEYFTSVAVARSNSATAVL